MIKDKVHSEYVRKLNEYKKRITVIQESIRIEKDYITMNLKLDPLTITDFEHTRLKKLKEENKFLTKEAITLKQAIRKHQKAKVTCNKLTYRMYSMVLRQLTPMQKGIQSLHAVVDYSEMIKKDGFTTEQKNAYSAWANRDKTMIVLDAGTSQDLIDAYCFLKENNIPFKEFHEPDLFNVITGVCFVADERVWDTKKYPTYEQYVDNLNRQFNDGYAVEGTTFTQPTKERWQATTFGNIDPEPYLALREFIFSKKLSM